MRLKNWFRLSVVMISASLLGCSPGGGGDQMPTHPVSGKVTLGGAPVPGATVTFSPVNTENPAAFSLTDSQGNFELTTYEPGDGAVAGEYKVIVSKSAPSNASAGGPGGQHDPTGASGQPMAPQHSGQRGGGGGGGSMLPEKYASTSTTPLQETVSEGENTVDISL